MFLGFCLFFFSVNVWGVVPPSLMNVYKELAVDVPGFRIPKHGYLQSWATQVSIRAGNSMHSQNSPDIGARRVADGLVSYKRFSH